MNKRYLILFVFLVVSGVLIVSSLNIARKNLNETVILKKQKAAFMESTKQGDLPRGLTSQVEIEEIEEEEEQAEEFILLEDIPDEYFEDEEKRQDREDYQREEAMPKIRKQPSIKELKELKRKGAIIY